MDAAREPRAPDPAAERVRRRLTVTGTVQGVGFRPFLHRLACAHGLAGLVRNDGRGVVAEVEGPAPAVAAFLSAVEHNPPVNAVIGGIDIVPLPLVRERGFRIHHSRPAAAAAIPVPPDLAVCEACLAEVFDPANRRHRHPFTNCTDCGPRYSIIRDLPYDRERTAMAGFALCPACAAEYHDPGDRRFHAEANACPDCGPRLALWTPAGEELAAGHGALEQAAEALRRGRILALKGLGGFQLLADARDPEAVARLRSRKRRPAKPFALMLQSLEAVEAICRVGAADAALLGGRERPIVLLRRRREPAPGAPAIADGVAPGNPWLGVMLPCTPLHHLLLAELGFPVIATSGNAAEEPIVTGEGDALERLAGIADAFLVHDRPILRPVDDSVARIVCGRPQILRRARGYAPAAVDTGAIVPGILAAGGHLKATLAFSRERGVMLSQHIGDLDGPAARDAYEAAGEDLQRLCGGGLRALACDLHPDYHSTRMAERWAAQGGLPLIRVQHHLAHVVAAMAEHGLTPPVLGVAWDGTGYGADGSIWGGEFLLVDAEGWRRVAHLRAFRLPGGEAAIRDPRRSALGLLHEIFGDAGAERTHLPPVAALTAAERRTLAVMLARNVNAPLASSAGRLFDAVSALLGLSLGPGYEGQAACALEWAAADAGGGTPYPFAIEPAAAGGAEWIIDWAPAVRAILRDRDAGRPPAAMSAAFHAGLAAAIAGVARRMGVEDVLLTGGCFQNARLTEETVAALGRAGHRPWWHRQVPPGDGGLALGQAVWAARELRGDAPPCA